MQAPARNRGRRDGWDEDARAPNNGLFAQLLAPALRKLLDRIDAGLAYGAIELTLPGGKGRRLGGR